MIVKQIYHRNVIFVTIGILKILVLNNEKYPCNGCHDLMQKTISFSNVAIVYVKGST